MRTHPFTNSMITAIMLLRADCGVPRRIVPGEDQDTALSLPYHIGNGIFGGLMPVIGLSVVANTGNIYAGLYYPIAVAAATFVVGSLLLKETHSTLIWKEPEIDTPEGAVSDMAGPA